MKVKYKFFLIVSLILLLLILIVVSCIKNENGNKNILINFGDVVVFIIEFESMSINK